MLSLGGQRTRLLDRTHLTPWGARRKASCNSPVQRQADLQPAWRIDLTGNDTEAAGVEIGAAGSEDGSVKDVERFAAQIDSDALGDGERLGKTDVFVQSPEGARLGAMARDIPEVLGLNAKGAGRLEEAVHAWIELVPGDGGAPAVVSGDGRPGDAVEKRRSSLRTTAW